MCMHKLIDRLLINSGAEKLIAAGWTDDNFRTKTAEDIPDTVIGYVSSPIIICFYTFEHLYCVAVADIICIVISGFKNRLQKLMDNANQ